MKVRSEFSCGSDAEDTLPKNLVPKSGFFRYYSSISGVPGGRCAMAIPDLGIPVSVGLSSAVRRSSASLRLCLPGILIFTFVVAGAGPCSAQGVAAAARQQRAQKEGRQKKSKHVYTEQDLKRAQILTP